MGNVTECCFPWQCQLIIWGLSLEKGVVQDYKNMAAAPHWPKGCVWYCSSVPFTSMEQSCNTRQPIDRCGAVSGRKPPCFPKNKTLLIEDGFNRYPPPKKSNDMTAFYSPQNLPRLSVGDGYPLKKDVQANNKH